MYRIVAMALVLALSGCQWQETKSAYGTIERELLQVNTSAAARITEVQVSKGQQVQKGQLLMQQDSEDLQLQLQQLTAALAAAQATLELQQAGSRQEQQAVARAALASAEAKLQDARLTQQRQAQLYQQGLSSDANLQQADAALAIASANQQVAAEQLAQTLAGNRQQEIEVARQQVKQLAAQREQVQWLIAQRSIVAERDGTVDDVLHYQGEQVAAGTTLLTLAVTDTAYARLYLPAEALARFKVGDEVALWLDTQQTPIQGQIRFISPQAAFTPHYALHQQERSRLVYLTEVALPDSAALRSGLPVRLALP